MTESADRAAARLCCGRAALRNELFDCHDIDLAGAEQGNGPVVNIGIAKHRLYPGLAGEYAARNRIGLGLAFTNVPLTFNLQTGENIAWKIKSPGPDFNSPVVWGDRVFLTSGNAKKREVFCYDPARGRFRDWLATVVRNLVARHRRQL